MNGNGTVIDRIRFEPVDLPQQADTPAKKHRRNLKRTMFGILLCIVCLAGSFLGSSWVFYRMENVVSQEAVVQARLSEVGARFDGVVAEVLVDENQRVEAGQEIARLDDRHLKAALQRAESELQRAERKLESAKLALTHEQARLEARSAEALALTSASTARLEAARQEAEQAEREFERISGLHNSGSGSDKEFRDARTLMQITAARRSAAQSDVQAAEAVRAAADAERAALAVRQSELGVYESDVARAHAAVAEAHADLDAAVIRAPHDGWVVRRIIEPGGSVRVGQPVLSLWADDEIWIDAWIEQSKLAQVEVGSPVTVSVEPYAGRVWTGVVESVNLAALDTEPASPDQLHTRAPLACVRIAITDPQKKLFPGLSAVVGIPKAKSAGGWAAMLNP